MSNFKTIQIMVLIFSLVGILLPSNALAQQGGSFRCSYNESSPVKCTTVPSCDTDYKPDANYCKQFKTIPSCNKAGSKPCVPINSNSGNNGGTEKSTSIQGSCDDNYVDTAIGCIPYGSTQDLVRFFLTWAIGIGGGIAFLFILYSSFLISTSSGDPKKAQAGRELLTSAIGGLILLLFSVFILRLVGVSIFGFGEFTK